MDRRHFIGAVTAMGLWGISHLSSATVRTLARRAAAHVVVIGGGFAGATAANYLRRWSQGSVQVTVVEPNHYFTSCPMSNRVLAGFDAFETIHFSYQGLTDHAGVNIIHDQVVHVDKLARKIQLKQGSTLTYDDLIIAPGIDFMPKAIEGLSGQFNQIPHAWKAGPQTRLLRQQLAAMADGGVFALHIPRSPYRCPPGPYERACLVAAYLQQHKPRSKLLVLDSNADIQSKKALFHQIFSEQYRDIIDYRPNSELLRVDAKSKTAEFEFFSEQVDVLNVLPPMRAGYLADLLDLPLINQRWVAVDYLSFQVKEEPHIYAIGDAIFAAPGMPKSAHMANQHAKVAVSAILHRLADEPPNPQPVINNTCYSFTDNSHAMHVAAVYRYDSSQATFLPVKGAGGLSEQSNQAEGMMAMAWANNIWHDALAL